MCNCKKNGVIEHSCKLHHSNPSRLHHLSFLENSAIYGANFGAMIGTINGIFAFSGERGENSLRSKGYIYTTNTNEHEVTNEIQTPELQLFSEHTPTQSDILW